MGSRDAMTKQPRTPHRRGTMYLLVLVTTMIITVIGIIGYKMMRTQAAVARADIERDEALVLAESGVQWGIHLSSLKVDWRDAYTSGVNINTMSIGEGTMAVAFIDDDGDLADDPLDPFWVRATGVVGDATQILEAQIELPQSTAHPALDDSLTVGGTLYIDDDKTFSLENGGTAYRHREADGDEAERWRVKISNPVEFPNPSLIQLWANKGTVIGRDVHGGKISGATLSDTQAPSGITPDPNGIYVIDTEGSNFDLEKCTVRGTLVIINSGTANIDIMESKFTFGDHGGPTLITDGETRLGLKFYPGVSQGIFYINGHAIIEQDMWMVGTVIVTGDLQFKTNYVSINDHPSATSGPPEGFHADEGYRLVAGSWRRVVQ